MLEPDPTRGSGAKGIRGSSDTKAEGSYHKKADTGADGEAQSNPAREDDGHGVELDRDAWKPTLP